MTDIARHFTVEFFTNFLDAQQEEVLQLRTSCGRLKCSFGLLDLQIVLISQAVVFCLLLIDDGLNESNHTFVQLTVQASHRFELLLQRALSFTEVTRFIP